MRRYYPAILERGPKGTVGLSFPDFPACVAGGASQEQAMEKAEAVLAQAVDALAEQDLPLPHPSDLAAIVIPEPASFIAFVMVGVEPPDPSERVNVYLPRRLIQRADARAAELGMSRSSFFGLVISTVLGSNALPVHTEALAEFWKRQTPGPVGAKKKAP